MASASAAGSPAAASPGPGPGSPDVFEAGASTPAPTAAPTSSKPGKGRSKDGTARKCANCGQVGHIKTNRKSVPKFSKFVCRCEVPNFGPEVVKESKPAKSVAASSRSRKRKSGPGLLDSNGIARTAREAEAAVTVPTTAAFAVGSLGL
jgi:hypothetical protein